jgi:type III secretory pathway component EscR
MNKLLSVIVAAMFAVSTVFVAAPVGAQTKDEKKTEKKAKSEKAKTEKAKTDKKAKTEKAKTDKKAAKKDEKK